MHTIGTDASFNMQAVLEGSAMRALRRIGGGRHGVHVVEELRNMIA
jgi:hypothetical protein